MKNIKALTLFQTKRGNKYLTDNNIKKTLLCHPLFHLILEKLEQGCDLIKWLEQDDNETIDISGHGSTLKSELLYYYRKFLLLKENGYFTEINQQAKLSARISSEDVMQSLANSPIITFEVTENCNLKCKYCGYGEFYTNYEPRQSTALNVETAKQFLLYLQKLWNSSLNISHDRIVYIGFYGGEPLMNFRFVQEIVSFSKSLDIRHNRISFSMTTNGMILDKYMDFLVKHDFNLLISLDGDKSNNSYRITKSGQSSHQNIMNNLVMLEECYPDYFKSKVNFNAVIHNRNSIPEAFRFFKKHFNKYPSVASLNTDDISDEKEEEFLKTYANPMQELYNSPDYALIEKEMFIKLPNVQGLTTFLHHGTDFSFKDYNELLFEQDNGPRFPTGTCLPFSKKVFITAKGRILVCERIGLKFKLGAVDMDGVNIDFDGIAQKYNLWYDKIRKQCAMCYNADLCVQCLFFLSIDEKHPTCNGFMAREDYSSYASSVMDVIEKKPELYRNILKEVRVN